MNNKGVAPIVVIIVILGLLWLLVASGILQYDVKVKLDTTSQSGN